MKRLKKNERKDLKRCLLPCKYDEVKKTYIFMKNPIKKVHVPARNRYALCGLKVIKPVSTFCLLKK